MNRLINQPCSVSTRLFTHRADGLGKSTQGSARANAIRGTPR